MKQEQDKLNKCISLFREEGVAKKGVIKIKILANKDKSIDKWSIESNSTYGYIKDTYDYKLLRYGVCSRVLNGGYFATPKKDIYPIELIPIESAINYSDILRVIKEGICKLPCFTEFVLCAGELGDLKNDIRCIFCITSDFNFEKGRVILKRGVRYLSLYCIRLNSEIMSFTDNKITRYFLSDRKSMVLKGCIDIDKIPLFDIKMGKEIIDSDLIADNDIEPKMDMTKLENLKMNEQMTSKSVLENINVLESINNENSIESCSLDEINTQKKESIRELSRIKFEIENKKAELNKIVAELNENNEILDENKEKLNKITEDFVTTDNSLKAKQKELLSIQQEIERQSNEKKRIEAEFEKKLEEKIRWAKDNMVEYLSNMALSSLVPSFHSNEPVKLLEEFNVHEINRKLDTTQDIHDFLLDNLDEIGVDGKYLNPFSLWLFAAIKTRTPLLLVGPSAQNIADAVSMSLFARKAAVFHCEGQPTHEAIRQIEDAESEVIAIHHLLQSKWTDYFPEILTIPNKHIFVIHPFVEDLQIEPKSLYSYMFPIFTEVLIKYQIQNSNFDNFNVAIVSSELLCAKKGSAVECDRVMHNLASKFVSTKIGALCGEFYGLMKLLNEDLDYYDNECLFCYLPYAYVTGQMDMLKRKLNGVLNVSDEIKKLVNSY